MQELEDWMVTLHNKYSESLPESGLGDVTDTFDLFQEATNIDGTSQIMRGMMKEQLTVYELDVSTHREGDSVEQWWKERKNKYAGIINIIQIVFCIPGSQIDNERVISVAGILQGNRRNRINVKSMDTIINIYRNFTVSSARQELTARREGITEEAFFADVIHEEVSLTDIVREDLMDQRDGE